MRVVLQRVSRASVVVRTGAESSPGAERREVSPGQLVGEIGPGLLLLVGFTGGDSEREIEWMADKVVGLRIFGDAEGKMNLSLDEVSGSILVVSQFTLYGDAEKGRRPSFVRAARPEIAIPLYRKFVAALEARVPGRVREGEFGAMMDVSLVNDGPVTLILERESRTPSGGATEGADR